MGNKKQRSKVKGKAAAKKKQEGQQAKKQRKGKK